MTSPHPKKKEEPEGDYEKQRYLQWYEKLNPLAKLAFNPYLIKKSRKPN